MLILRNCIFPRAIHLLRSSFASRTRQQISDFDSCVRVKLRELLGTPLAENSHYANLAALKLRDGGGIFQASTVLSSTYIVSWVDASLALLDALGRHPFDRLSNTSNLWLNVAISD